MYRRSVEDIQRYREKMARMSHERNRQIATGPCPDYPLPVPNLRRQIIVRDFDFGTKELQLDLMRSNRIDCYSVVHEGLVIDHRAGWSTVLEEYVRKEFVRVLSV